MEKYQVIMEKFRYYAEFTNTKKFLFTAIKNFISIGEVGE